jgi:CheY-like chemotaxis protein
MIPFGTAHLAPDLLCDVVVSGESTEPTAAGLDFSHEILDEMNQNWNKRSAPAGRDTREGASVASSESLTSRSSKRVDLSTLYFKKTDIIMIVDGECRQRCFTDPRKDVPANRAYIRSIFEPFCSIIEAHEGQDALTKFTYLQPDLIIADVMISRVAGRRWDDQRNLNGVELLRELRQGTKEQQMVPVIMLTGVDEPDLGSLRADDTIVRPFKSKELIARAHMQMQLGKRRRMLEQLFEERTMELRVLTENSPVAIFLCDSTGAMTYGNAAWYEISGTPVEDGKDDPDMVLDWKPYIMERYVNMFEDLDQWTETGGRGVETECQWKNGRWCKFLFCFMSCWLTTSQVPSGCYV